MRSREASWGRAEGAECARQRPDGNTKAWEASRLLQVDTKQGRNMSGRVRNGTAKRGRAAHR